MNSLRLGIVAGFLTLGLVAGALAAPTPTPKAQPTSTAGAASQPSSPEELDKKVKELNLKLDKLFKDKKFKDAQTVSDQLIKLVPDKPDGHYAKACALAGLGKKKDALDSLETCVKTGFAAADFMDKDKDLLSLHKEAKYAELLAKVKENEQKKKEDEQKKAASGDQGEEIAGVKTVVGTADDGYPYRLRMSPTATADKPNRLIVWFHNVGGVNTKEAEQMSLEMNKRGFALLVFTPKDFPGWQPEEIKKAVMTMGKASEVKGIDGKKPILFGYGLGGQATLGVYLQNGGKLGGIVLNAAYPIMGFTPQRQPVMMNPAGELAKLVPFFVLVGEKDDGAFTWKKAEEIWIPRGVPLTVHYVADKAKGWLFDKEQTEALMKWLENPNLAASQPAN